MSRIKRARRWPAVSVAVAALLVALVGTAIAESGPATKSASIKSVSKGVKKALKKSNRAIRISRQTSKMVNRAGHPGPPGLPGQPGPPGPTGAQGPPGVSDVEIVEVETPSNEVDTKEEAAECPSGKRVLGGGAAVEGDFTDVAIDLSAPDGDDAWRAAAHEHDAAEPWRLDVYAICAETD